MKRVVVINRAGDILATADHYDQNTTRKLAPGDPPHHKYIPLPGQTVHVVEFPDEASGVEAILEFHRTHKVRVVRGTARLEPRGRQRSGGRKRKGARSKATTKSR